MQALVDDWTSEDQWPHCQTMPPLDQTIIVVCILTFYWFCHACLHAAEARASLCLYSLFRSNSLCCRPTRRIVLLTAVCDFIIATWNRGMFYFSSEHYFYWIMCLFMMLFQLRVGLKIVTKCYSQAFIYLTYKHFYCPNVILWVEIRRKTKRDTFFDFLPINVWNCNNLWDRQPVTVSCG